MVTRHYRGCATSLRVAVRTNWPQLWDETWDHWIKNTQKQSWKSAGNISVFGGLAALTAALRVAEQWTQPSSIHRIHYLLLLTAARPQTQQDTRNRKFIFLPPFAAVLFLGAAVKPCHLRESQPLLWLRALSPLHFYLSLSTVIGFLWSSHWRRRRGEEMSKI